MNYQKWSLHLFISLFFKKVVYLYYYQKKKWYIYTRHYIPGGRFNNVLIVFLFWFQILAKHFNCYCFAVLVPNIGIWRTIWIVIIVPHHCRTLDNFGESDFSNILSWHRLWSSQFMFCFWTLNSDQSFYVSPVRTMYQIFQW